MLNRRILRVKAMQALYSYFLAQESLQKVIGKQLESQYHLDPAKDDFTDADIFTAKQKEALRLYKEFLPSKKVVSPEDADEEICENVQAHINKYYTAIDKEVRTIERNMTDDVNNLETLYLKITSVITEIAELERQEKEKIERAHVPKVSFWKYHFIDNPVIDALTKFEAFNDALLSNETSWKSDLDKVRDWYKDIFKNDEYLIEYQKKDSPSLDEHKDAVIYVFKKLIFKNEVIADYFSLIDLHWAENQPILKSLVVKTFQEYEHDLDEPFAMREVSRNEEDDISFFKKIFKETIQKERELDEIIAGKTKNWDISRVALMDRIILRMSIAEMMSFPSIPVKVTINEFIEISKNYSTPKSKQFINGILDVLANQLTSEGVIRKSGRGLIDNK